ncbi:MAG TPA: DUF3263 domain-containing protein [Micromonosporaceae bacterium]|jgi:hypothetical protein|nr:DUF3263 domain-containing protein [Micromonosporaceae bacterium]
MDRAADVDVSADAAALIEDVTDDFVDGDAEVGLDGGGVPPVELTEREMRVLAFERQWWRHAGAKEQAIRDTFDVSATRYYQLLNALLESPAALAQDPMLVKRLRRLRAARVRTRARGAADLSRGA